MHFIKSFVIDQKQIFLRGGVLALLAYVLYDLVFNTEVSFSALDFKWDFQTFSLAFLVFCLMIFNWLIEALKWKWLIQPFQSTGVSSSFRAVLMGTSTALFTPNRMGDFIGKLSVVSPKNRTRGLVAAVYSSSSQLLITLIMGLVGLVWMTYNKHETGFADLLMPFVVLIVFLGLMAYYLRSMPRFLTFRLWRLWSKGPTTGLKTRVLVLSALRYGVFSFQFILLLSFFGAGLSTELALAKIALFYLLISAIPATFWGELGVKESVAVWIFSDVVFNGSLLLAVTLSLWTINLAIPAVFGSYFWWKTDLNK